MTDPHFPPTRDEDLTPETLEVLGTLPPLNIFRALAALVASLRPFLEPGGRAICGRHTRPGPVSAPDP
jgi:hypothetical protein